MPEASQPAPGSGAEIRSWRAVVGRQAWRYSKGVAVLYLMVVLVFYGLQTKLIFPGSVGQGQLAAQIKNAGDAELVELSTADGHKVTALFGRALRRGGASREDAQTRPTILYFYGNGMSLVNVAQEFAAFRQLGANVMIPDYVGYGMSGGEPSEAGCYATADAAYAWLASSPDVDSQKIIVGGWSLGAAVAADLAVRRPVAGLMMFSAFTSLADVAGQLYPFLPVRWLLKHRFESLAKLPQFKGPTLIAHGDEDDLAPYAMSERLAKAAAGQVTHLRIEGAGHNDFWSVGANQILAATGRLIENVAKGK
jgi:pimeloyl-ACP methyl ester carboxylesterase